MINEHSSKKEVIEAVSKNGFLLRDASEELQNDEHVVCKAVFSEGSAIIYASPELKTSERVLSLAIHKDKGNDASAFKFASQEKQNNPEFILSFISINPRVFDYIPLKFKNDRDFILKVVAQTGAALEYVPLKFREDRDVVLMATAQRGEALKHASPLLQKDKFLKAVSELPSTTSAFSALLPMKKKLASEKDKESIVAISTMIEGIEQDILSYSQNNEFDFKTNYENRIRAAKPTLERLPLWKRLIDDFTHYLSNLLPSFKKQESEVTSTETNTNTPKNAERSSSFSNPNPLKEELTKFKEDIRKTLNLGNEDDNSTPKM